MKSDNIIDFVVTWVDDSDPKWKRVRAEYAPFNDTKTDNDDVRFRDWGLLKYWFRAVEENAPWVRKIHFVTFGHVPTWLNTNNPKLQIVKHADFIDKEFLPTFNSCAIEVNLHRIPGLADKFVYFNDDMFLNRPVFPEDFFLNGRPRASYVLTKLNSNDQANRIRSNCNRVANRYGHFLPGSISPKNGVLMVASNFSKIPFKAKGFCSKHAPASYTKKAFVDLWEMEGARLKQTSSHRFRMDEDYSQWLFEYYQLYTGLSLPRCFSKSKYYDVACNSSDAIKDILKPKHAMICLNDTTSFIPDVTKIQKRIKDAFEKRYPESSIFEKGAR